MLPFQFGICLSCTAKNALTALGGAAVEILIPKRRPRESNLHRIFSSAISHNTT